MSTADAVAVVLWVGATMYAVFGGADFGAGFWSLVAGGGERGRRARELIDWAIGPVWEANHVWLIFVLVVLWTGFSSAFAAIFSTLFIPLSLAALGIVLRGSGFAFHKTARRPGRPEPRRAPVRPLLAAHPVLHGHRRRRNRIGARAARQRRRRPRHAAGSTRCRSLIGRCSSPRPRTSRRCSSSATLDAPAPPTSSATSPSARSVRRWSPVRSRSPASSTSTTTRRISTTGSPPKALPLVIFSALCGLGVLVLLRRGAARGGRALAVGAVVAVIWGWGVAQYPYLLPKTLTIADGAAPSATLTSVLIVFGVAVVLVLPALALLFTLAQRDLIQESEGPQPDRNVPIDPTEPEPTIPDGPGAELDARARRTLGEARTEAVVVLAVDVALFGGLAAMDKAKDWDVIDLPWWTWLLLAAPAVLLIVLLLAVPLAELSPGRARNAGLAMLGLLIASDAVAVGALLAALAGSSAASLSAGELLAHGAVVWLTNIITFGLLFWQLDEGGPRLRAERGRPDPDFEFPQDAHRRAGWSPRLSDYLYVSLTNGIAVSPTDTMPLSRRAKGLMAVESLISYTVVILVVARAVNVLGAST